VEIYFVSLFLYFFSLFLSFFFAFLFHFQTFTQYLTADENDFATLMNILKMFKCCLTFFFSPLFSFSFFISLSLSFHYAWQSHLHQSRSNPPQIRPEQIWAMLSLPFHYPRISFEFFLFFNILIFLNR
jgi:hypothetical protein